MTITLHWWMIPAALVLLGLVLAWLDDSTGYLGGMAGAFGLFVCFAMAIAFTVGHFV